MTLSPPVQTQQGVLVPQQSLSDALIAAWVNSLQWHWEWQVLEPPLISLCHESRNRHL